MYRIVHCPKNPPALFISCFPESLANADIFIASIILPFSEYRMVVIIHCVGFSHWLFSLSNMSLKLPQVFSEFNGSFLFSAI